MNNGKYRSKQDAMDMLLAYAIFIDEGMRAVENMYPQYKAFVLTHQGKTVTEVKHELLLDKVAC